MDTEEIRNNVNFRQLITDQSNQEFWRSRIVAAKRGMTLPSLRPLAHMGMSICMSLHIAACTAQFEVPATIGQIDDYVHEQGVSRQMRLAWSCRARSPLSAMFSPTGSRGCDDADGRGEIFVSVDNDGRYVIPHIERSVTKLMSVPAILAFWEMYTVDAEGRENVQSLFQVEARRAEAFREEFAEALPRLIAFPITAACRPARITAVDAGQRFPFENVREIYPKSYNFTLRMVGSVVYENNGTNKARATFEMPYRDGAFCGGPMTLFALPDAARAHEMLRYFVETSVFATVVKPRDERHSVGRRQTSKAQVPAAAGRNSFPEELLNPIEWELEIPASKTSDP